MIDKAVREITAKIDAMASRGVLSVADVEVIAVELGKAVADRCVAEIDAGAELEEAATRAASAVGKPFELILSEFAGGPAEAARQRLHRAAVSGFKVRIVELRRN